MSEITIKICDDGDISVVENTNGILSFKMITPDSLLDCINKSLSRGVIMSGLLPRGCLSYAAHDNGDRDICILHDENTTNMIYYDTEYKDFPLPRLVFGFHITGEGRVSSCRLGVVADDDVMKPNTKMFHYPFSNVSGFQLCTGNNILPKCISLHTMGSLPYYVLSMPNNNDHFKSENNSSHLEMRDLLELVKDKKPEFYYSDILVQNGSSLNDFINGGNKP